MSDILKSILGLVVDKARSATASSLSDGDLTDERMREVIISNIDDIKSSLRGLSRQHLNSSLSFLKEGISRMGLAVQDTSTSTQNVQTAITHAAEEFVTGASASTTQQTKQRTVNQALSLSNLKIVSQERWVGAKESFKMSREQATIAFGNTALSIEDRIMASKLRIASSILEKFLEDPEVGAQDCLLYLQELHDLPAIRETFTVHRDGGLKSRFNKTKRSVIVESLTTINDIVFDFIVNFTEMIFSRPFKWPAIQLTDSERKEHIFEPEYKMRRKVHKKKEENRIKLMKKRKENCIKLIKKRWPNFEFADLKKKRFSGKLLAVNSAGGIYSPGNYYLKRADRADVVSRDIGPNDDILYTLHCVKACRANEVSYLKLEVDDLKNNSCREFTKGLPPTRDDTSWVMRVLKNKIVLCNAFGEVFILTYNETQDHLNLECSFSLPSIDIPREKLQNIRMQPYMCVTDKCEVFIAGSHGKEVYICPITEEGQMEGMIRVPLEQHKTESKVSGVAFDVTHEEDIVVLRDSGRLEARYQIEVYSRNGNIWNVYPLPGNYFTEDHDDAFLLSNPKGIFAVIRQRSSFRWDLTECWHLVGKVFLEQERKFP